MTLNLLRETGSLQQQGGSDHTPLILDLDGTVTRTDTLVESLLRILATNPLALLMLVLALPRGRAAFKQAVAGAAKLDPATLVYNDAVLDLAREAREAGRKVFLVTAADGAVAEAVAAHLGLFDGVFASDGALNLKGANKAQFLVDTFGEAGFDYAGDAQADRPVWRRARQAILVLPSVGLAREMGAACAQITVVGRRPGRVAQLKLTAKAIRVHQWAKNALIFVPMLAAHQMDMPTLLRAAAAFAAFSLCASSVYLLNDLVDLPHDRLHPSKRRRPFASGALSLSMAPGLMLALLGGGFLIAAALPLRFFLLLLLYYGCTLSYSFVLKRMMMVDVMTLAGLYTIRVFAGAGATSISVSPWLLAFCMFLFLCLAVVKRQTELTLLVKLGLGKISGRGYLIEDIDMLRSMAAASGYMAVVVMALYISSRDVGRLYDAPKLLWLLCPVLLFWINRVLMLSHRGQMNDDPVVFALKDRVSLLTGAVALCIFIIAMY